MTRRLGAIVAVTLALTGCGRKGPPVAPETRAPRPPHDLSATVETGAIALTWVNPTSRVDRSRLRDLAVARLHRVVDDGHGEPKPAILSGDRVVGYTELATIDLAAPPPGPVQGNRISYVDRASLEEGRRYTYVVTASDSQGRSSSPSARLSVAFLTAPEPPAPPAVSAGEGRVELTWSAPTQLADGRPVAGTILYEVLRAVAPDATPTPVTPMAIAATRYTDSGLENGRTYYYAIRAIRAEAEGVAQSPPSGSTAATPRKVTPPAPPTNLVAIPSAGGVVRLRWDPSPNPDVGSYVIDRRGASGPAVRVGSVDPPSTAFIDRDVPSGRYRYSVTAVDTASPPNESVPSEPADVDVP
jgi:predicted small lipoprotein YifL